MSEAEPQSEHPSNTGGRGGNHLHWIALPSNQTIELVGTYAALFAVMAVLFVVTTWLSRSYASTRQRKAADHYAMGNRLAAEHRDDQAVLQYRTALNLQPANTEYRLPMALALLRLGRLDESETHLTEILQADPTDGPANLAMARIAGQEGEADAATSYYHRAIYGLWPGPSHSRRLDARLELVNVLAAANQKSQLLAELIALRDEMPPDPALKQRIARLFLAAGSASNARDLLQEVIRSDRNDELAYVGLGDAELELENYTAALRAYQAAARLNPADADAKRKAGLARNILALDPTLAGLGSNEGHVRGKRLLVLALSQLDLCSSRASGEASSSIEALRQQAQQRIAERPRASLDDTGDADLSLASAIWRERQELCPQTQGSQEAVGMILRRQAQTSQ